MVNFADAVTKVSYGKLRTTTPNAKGVEKFLHNVALTNTKPLGGLPSLMAEDAMYSMGAKVPKFNLKAYIDRFSQVPFEPCGSIAQEIYAPGKPKVISAKLKDLFV